jgi:hypothetical protein
VSRLVVLTGTAQLNVVIGEAVNYEKNIADALSNAGFDVKNVAISKGIIFGNGINVTIECYVDDQYTAQQARESATAVIGSIPNVNFSLSFADRLFSQISLQVLSDGRPLTATENAVNNDTLTKLLSTGEVIVNKATENLTSNIGTPLAIGAVVIVVFLALRK